MSSPVSLFKAAAVVVDPKSGKAPRRGPHPEIHKEPPSRPCPKVQPATSISSLPLPLLASAHGGWLHLPHGSDPVVVYANTTGFYIRWLPLPCAVLANLVQVKVENGVHGRW